MLYLSKENKIELISYLESQGMRLMKGTNYIPLTC